MSRTDEIWTSVVLSESGAKASESLGSHYFVSLPRIGEDIAVTVDGRNQSLILTVVGLLHNGDPADKPPPEDLGIPSVTLFCKKL